MIPLPMPPKIISEEDHQAVFEIEELYPGYGETIGNSLRRILLSSLPGTAITKIKIEDAPHEFTTLDGVKEDVILIMLNLKKIRFQSHDDEAHEIHLKKKGNGEVTAGDFETPPQLTIVNTEQPIATLTKKKATLEITATVESGIGYRSKPADKSKDGEIGEIALDAIFSPVQRVSFQVENMIVEKRTDFNRLLLTVETDGTMSPKEAFVSSAKILEEHFSSLAGAFTIEEKPSIEDIEKPISEMDLSTRTENNLKEAGIETLADLLNRPEEEIEGLKGIGKKSFENIKKQIEDLGLSFKS